MTADVKQAIGDLEYSVAKYGRQNTFTLHAYEALSKMKQMQRALNEIVAKSGSLAIAEIAEEALK